VLLAFIPSGCAPQDAAAANSAAGGTSSSSGGVTPWVLAAAREQVPLRWGDPCMAPLVDGSGDTVGTGAGVATAPPLGSFAQGTPPRQRSRRSGPAPARQVSSRLNPCQLADLPSMPHLAHHAGWCSLSFPTVATLATRTHCVVLHCNLSRRTATSPPHQRHQPQQQLGLALRHRGMVVLVLPSPPAYSV
jgi:hypothetical protein